MESLNYVRGQVFMSILTLVLIIIIAWAIYFLIKYAKKRKELPDNIRESVGYLKSFGLLAIIIGLLDQLIVLYLIISAIEEAGDITVGIVLNALKASMTPMIYGICIFLFSLLTWLIFDLIFKSKIKSK
mgnify:CR=1 FL=1